MESRHRFSLIGSLRSGSSLLSRCLDDHLSVICLCESEINRALFSGHFYLLHFRRMRNHGLEPEEIMRLLDGKRHGDLVSFEAWYHEVLDLLRSRYEKPEARFIGDKSPDFFRSPALVEHLLSSQPLIYTARDPRAIYRSIQADLTNDSEKRKRWEAFRKNAQVWMPHLHRASILTVKYENFVGSPSEEMVRIHDHLGLKSSQSFLTPGIRKFARRFLWKQNVDMVTGEVRAIDPASADKWISVLSPEEIQKVESDPTVREYCERFGYELTRAKRALQPRASTQVPLSGKTALMLDWGKGRVLNHIAASLSKLGYRVLRQDRANPDVPEIIRLIEEERPDLTVTRQRFYRGMDRVSNAIRENGGQTLFIDLGVWPHYQSYLMDSRGDNATSAMVGSLHRLETNPGIRAYTDEYMTVVDKMRSYFLQLAEEADMRKADLHLEGLEDFSFLILQREGDQVLIHDGPKALKNPNVLAKAAITEAERSSRFVVIKPHPLSADKISLPETGPHHRVVRSFKQGSLNQSQLAWLMLQANNAVMINSTSHFQTLVLGTPTACLGQGWFSGNGVVVETPDMNKALSNTKSFPSDRYLGHMLSRQLPVRMFAQPTELDRLIRWVLRCDPKHL